MPQDVLFSIPFEAPISPYLDHARSRHLAWVRERGLIRTEDGMREYIAWDLPEAVGRTYPHASADDQFLLMNWFALAFLFDDDCDTGPGTEAYSRTDAKPSPAGAAVLRPRSPERPDRVAEIARELITIPFREPGTPPDLVSPITLAWSEVWASMSEGTSVTWQNRFAANWARFLAAHASEMRMSESRAVPDLDSYRVMRRNTAGIPHSLDAIERSRRFEVPPQIQAHPLMRRLREAATDTIAYINDIQSPGRRGRRVASHNLVAVLRDRLDCSYDVALREATRMTYEQLDTFMTLQAYMPQICGELGLGTADRIAVEMSVEGMRNWIRGYYDWGLHSGPYAVPDVLPDEPMHGRAEESVDPTTAPLRSRTA
ncbi:terpene synthase family protein [Embleya hyalina]|uniref:Terpene synthase n=1 Tax=Embleya hyalina TaxID=516124 RepID=A0A401YSP5_9ACTN|nr:terpene cyclase [Embleya hyalina]GCD97592.1 terpene synthase [Embleya hyalina]